MIIAAISILSACSGSSKKSNESDELTLSAPAESGALELSEEVMSDVIQNISSPVEMAAIIKATGVDFSQKILNDADKVDNYNTSYKRALNLGVYSADLGYINTFDKNNIVVSYLVAIKSLSEGIKVGQFFDFNALKRMATNNNNLDSLMQISISSFNQMDSYLRSQKRSNVSSLIVTGAWIEGLYLTGNVIEQTNNESLVNRIAEQKDIINIIEIIIKNYGNDPDFAELAQRLGKLKSAYDGVKITTEFAEPQTIEQDGKLIIVQDEISHVEVTPEQMNAIINEIKSLREFIVS
jgi:regulator of RNase E activity RraB